jgi:TolB protein
MKSHSIIVFLLCLSYFSCKHSTDLEGNKHPVTYVRKAKVLFSSNRTGNRNIFMMNPDGSDVIQVTHYSQGDCWACDVSPDGRYLLFDKGSDNAMDISVFLIEFGVTEPTIPLDYGQAGNFFPDGKRFIYDRHIFTTSGGFEQFIIFDLRDSSKNQVNRDSTVDFGIFVSPNGNRICYGSWRPLHGPSQQIFSRDIGDTNEIQLTPSAIGYYAIPGRFMPNGTNIVFSYNSGSASRDIYLVNPLGGTPVPITSGLSNNFYAPFPDSAGNNVYFHGGVGNDREIYSVNVVTKSVQRLTNNQWEDRDPIFAIILLPQ